MIRGMPDSQPPRRDKPASPVSDPLVDQRQANQVKIEELREINATLKRIANDQAQGLAGANARLGAISGKITWVSILVALGAACLGLSTLMGR